MKIKINLLLQDIPKLLKQEWKGVHQSVQISWNTLISFKYLTHWKNDIKVIEFNVLYISYHVPLFCIMCLFVENE